jgi:inorganic pyrophosphatase
VTQPVASITAEADAAIRELITSVKNSVSGAVSDAAQKISQDFTEHVKTELTEMTKKFKETHPAVTQAVTDVVGYADAISSTAAAVEGAATQIGNTATQIKALPGSIRDIRTGLRDAATEAGKLGRDLRGMVADAPGAIRNLGTAISTNLTKAFAAARTGAANASAAVGRFVTSARGVAVAVGGAVRSLVQLAAGYARAAVQTVIATVRTVAMTIAQRVIAVATRLWAVAQALLNVAMRLNPLGLIITGITLLVGLIVLAYQRSSVFRAIVEGAMRAVSAAIGWVVNAAKAVFTWVRANWPLLLAILTGPIGLAVLAIVRNWDNIKAAVAAVKDWIVARWNDVVGFLSSIPDRITSIANRMWEGFKNAARGAINFLIDAWNSIDFGIHIHIPSWVPLIGGKGIDIDDIVPDIPRLAEGGLVPRRPGGVLALLGEGDEDEVVIPLSRLNPVLGQGATPITVNVHPRAGQSEYEIGRVAAREIAWAAKH